MKNTTNNPIIRRDARNPTYSFVLSIFSVGIFFISSISLAHATINCAGYLPSSYFERIEAKEKFAGKLVEQADGTQQLQDSDGKVIIDGLTNAHILMDKYVLAQRLSNINDNHMNDNDKNHNAKYGVISVAGKTIVPFEYDEIQTEPDIATSFIVRMNTPEGSTKQGIINRHGKWVYPLAHAHIQHAHYDPDYDQDYFVITEADSQSKMSHQKLTGLLDDKGYWAIMPNYDSITPLNACTGKPLYVQVSLKNERALLDQNGSIVVAFAPHQHIESFNMTVNPLLFLRSALVVGSTATGMSEDIQDEITSAQIIDVDGKLLVASESPIRKLLYHQLYTYKQAGKYGLLNDQGEVILKPQFDRYEDEGSDVWFEKNGERLHLNTLIERD